MHCPLLQHHCVVPNYDCAVSALAIHPSTNNLVIAYSDQQVGALLVELSWPCSLPCLELLAGADSPERVPAVLPAAV